MNVGVWVFKPQIVRWVQDLGFKVFLDLKFHDIPNTVNRACYAAAELGVSILNVHALGGIEMMKAAKEGVNSSKSNTKIDSCKVYYIESETKSFNVKNCEKSAFFILSK